MVLFSLSAEILHKHKAPSSNSVSVQQAVIMEVGEIYLNPDGNMSLKETFDKDSGIYSGIYSRSQFSSVGYCSTQEVDVCGAIFTCEEYLSTYESDIGQKIPPGEQRNIRSYESINNHETFIANKSYDVNLCDGYHKTSIQEEFSSDSEDAIENSSSIQHFGLLYDFVVAFNENNSEEKIQDTEQETDTKPENVKVDIGIEGKKSCIETIL